MKKVIAIIAVLMFAPALAFAQTGLNVGDSFLSISIGEPDAKNEIENSQWGNKEGVSFGVQYLRTIAPVLAFGVEANGNLFSKTENFAWDSYYNFFTEEVETSIFNFMLAGRLYLNRHAARVYVPFGTGVGISRFEISARKNGSILGKEKETTTGLAWYAGLGFEGEISNHIVLGIEGRINGTSARIDMLEKTYYPLYITVMARLGFKF